MYFVVATYKQFFSLNERLITLEEIDPIDFFGPNNLHVNLIKSYYPKLKLVVRGNQIKAYGESIILDEFEKKIQILINYLAKYNQLDETSIEQLLISSTTALNKKNAHENVLLHGVGGTPIKPQTQNQKNMVKAMANNDMLFAVGPAGTGKTYTAVAMAVRALKEKEVKKIILTRPAVESGENLGFLPGDMKEKLDPYMQPLYDALRDMIPAERLASHMEKGIIQIAPLAFMRGRTLDNAFVILDEAQNTTHSQMKMFLTRMGKRAKFVINGDPGQIDLPRKQVSGLKEALLALKDVKGIKQVFLDGNDVIRHRLVKDIITAYKSIEIE